MTKIKNPFPKGATEVCAVILEDGIIFNFRVPVAKTSTATVRVLGILRAKGRIRISAYEGVEKQYTPWMVECNSPNSGSGYLDPLWFFKGYSATLYKQPWGEGSEIRKISDLVETIRVRFDSFYIEGLYMSALDMYDLGTLRKTNYPSPRIDDCLDSTPVVFDLTLGE